MRGGASLRAAAGRPGNAALIVGGRPVHGGGLTGGLFGVGDPLGKVLDLPLQPVDQLPLRRDGLVQLVNRLVLMDHTHFKLIEAGGVR